MTADDGTADAPAATRRPSLLAKLRRLARSRDGATAIEFALLAIPYFMIIFAIIETFVAFTAEQLVSNAVDTLARQLRTGQITYLRSTTTDKNTVAAFNTAFCKEISILIRCTAADLAAPSKTARLYLDVQSYANFGAIPTAIPFSKSSAFAGIDYTGFKYAPGGPTTVNMLRAYYRWPITVDILRPYITTISTSGVSPTDFLIVATAAYQNEKYP